MKDPAFLFYPADWMGGTMGMTFEQKGAYMDLLVMQFNRGHMTTHMIGHMLGQDGGQIWEAIKDKFKIDADGRFYNERLEFEQLKRKAFTDSRKNNIKGKNQYSKEDKKHGHKEGHMSGHMTSHMENENINSILDIKKEKSSNKSKIEIAEEFYARELKLSNNDSNYKQLIDLLFGNNDAGLRLDGILGMKNQMGYKQFVKLFEKAKSKNTKLTPLILSFENGKYYSDKKSFYLSINDWLNKR